MSNLRITFQGKDMEGETKHRSIFLVNVGTKTYKLIQSFVAIDVLKIKSYEELALLVQDITTNQNHRSHSQTIVQRLQLNLRCQNQSETFSMLMTELKRLIRGSRIWLKF